MILQESPNPLDRIPLISDAPLHPFARPTTALLDLFIFRHWFSSLRLSLDRNCSKSQHHFGRFD